jgi:molybdate transport system substrate-binding protein
MAKLKVMCARSMQEAVTARAYDFTRATGQETELSFGTVGALEKRLDAGEIADVLISAVEAIDRRIKAGTLDADSRTPVATTRIGVAIRDGAKTPDISTPDAFKKALRAAHKIAFSDAAVGGSAGDHLARLFEDIGLAPMIKRKGLPQQSGGEVAARVAEGSADLGMTLIAEIVPVEGVHVLGPLPAPYGKDTTYCAAVMTGSDAPKAARAFIAALVQPDVGDLWSSLGFEMAVKPAHVGRKLHEH